MRTEIKEGKRVWTKDSIETILKCSFNSKLSEKKIYQSICGLLSEGLEEIGFSSSHYDRLSVWEIQKDNWSCHIKLINPIDCACFILIDLDKYSIGDLVYLWDNIRSSWLSRQG